MASFILAIVPLLLQLHRLYVKVLSYIARGTPPQIEGKTGHWLAFSLYNPHFFLEILDQECALFNLLEKILITY